jgi:hypothetical protein
MRHATAYGLSKSTGVNVRSIQRWINGEQDLALASADRLAAALGLRLVDSGRRGQKPPLAAVPSLDLPPPELPAEAVVDLRHRGDPTIAAGAHVLESWLSSGSAAVPNDYEECRALAHVPEAFR